MTMDHAARQHKQDLVNDAVEMARTMLRGDGYDVILDDRADGELRLTVVAGPNACKECLVPKEVLATVMTANLPAELAATRISLTYPGERTG